MTTSWLPTLSSCLKLERELQLIMAQWSSMYVYTRMNDYPTSQPEENSIPPVLRSQVWEIYWTSLDCPSSLELLNRFDLYLWSHFNSTWELEKNRGKYKWSYHVIYCDWLEEKRRDSTDSFDSSDYLKVIEYSQDGEIEDIIIFEEHERFVDNLVDMICYLVWKKYIPWYNRR